MSKTKAPTAKQIISKAKQNGYEITRADTLNGVVAYKVSGAGVNRFALWTAREIGAEILGWAV
jgi:hypothetical protein